MNSKSIWPTSSRLSAVRPSVITEVAEFARQLKLKGSTIYNLSVGEPDFSTDPHICQAAVDALSRGDTRYPRTQGSDDLVDAIRVRYQTDYDIHVSEAQVQVGNGAKQILYNAFSACLNDGDEVIFPSPYWSSYKDIVGITGGVPVVTPMQADRSLQPDIDAIARAITSRTKLILLNSPGNPSGVLISDASIEGIFDLMRQHSHVNLIVDEIYDKIVFDDRVFRTAHQLAPDLSDRILVVNGVSKTYAMTGWRIGYGIGPEPLISAMTLVQGQSTSGACSIAQAAAAAALSGSQDGVVKRLKNYQERRDVMVSLLHDACKLRCIRPEGAFYALPDVTSIIGRSHPIAGKITDDTALCKAVLQVSQVALVPGSAFGAPNHIRLSFAVSQDELRNGLTRLAEFIAECQ